MICEAERRFSSDAGKLSQLTDETVYCRHARTAS
jgi:hypothetical protein